VRILSLIRSLLKGWLLSFAGWSLVALVMAAYGVTTRDDAWSMHVDPSIRVWLPWAIVTPLLFRLVAWLPIDRRHWKISVPVHVLACALVMTACHWWKTSFRPPPGFSPFGPGRRFAAPPGPPPDVVIRDQRRPPGPGSPGPVRVRRIFFDMFGFMSFELPIYLMIVMGAHATLFYRRDQERAASLARARLDALRMQLQPHFLFNTLNTIGGLVYEDPQKADAILTALSDLLRMSLETSRETELPLSREMEFVERYLAIMHARFEERVRFQIDLEPEVRDALVPPMLLQPIVENAVEHGLQPKPAGGVVTVKASRREGFVRLEVRDDGVGLPASTSTNEGVGLQNTRARLRELYGDHATIELRNESGTTVEILIPFRVAKSGANT
jgi:two-component sensor histidine kinase